MMQRVHWCACARVRDSLLQWDVSGGISAQWRWWICAHVINIQMAFGLVEMRDCEVAKTKPKFISRTQSLLKHILASFVRIRTPHQLLRSCVVCLSLANFIFKNWIICSMPVSSPRTQTILLLLAAVAAASCLHFIVSLEYHQKFPFLSLFIFTVCLYSVPASFVARNHPLHRFILRSTCSCVIFFGGRARETAERMSSFVNSEWVWSSTGYK